MFNVLAVLCNRSAGEGEEDSEEEGSRITRDSESVATEDGGVASSPPGTSRSTTTPRRKYRERLSLLVLLI